MTKKAYIIHGAYGSPDENWVPWLKKELEKMDYKVFTPKFPTPDDQNLENWMKVFEPYFEKVDEDSIFVGHSLGPAFILSVLERIQVKVKACFFVAPFITNIGNPDFDIINKTFYKNFDWKKIKHNCKKFYIFQSDNDPYVPMEKGGELASNLHIGVIKLKNAGHFNKDAGYTEFPELFDCIIKEEE